MIWQYAATIVMAGVLAVLQTTVFPHNADKLYLDFLFVMVVVIGLVKDPIHGAVMSFIIGGVEDVISGQLPGFFMTARLVTFYAAQYTRARLAPETALSQATIGLGLRILDWIVLLVLYHVFVESDSIPRLTVGRLGYMMLGVGLSAILTPLFFQLFKIIPGFHAPRRGPRISR